nr:disease resistance protein rpp8 [Quercus suber]
MDVEAVVSIVIRKLTDLLIQEPIIFNNAIDEIELVRISLRQMQSFLIEAEDKKEHDEGVKKWVDQFLAVVYEVEDAIETFVLRKMYATRMGYFFIPKNLKADSDLCKKIEGIKDKIKNLDKSKTEMDQGEPLRIRQLTLHRSRSSYQDEGLTLNQQNNDSRYSVDEETDFIGFKKDKGKLVTMLTGSGRESGDYQKLPLISGVGKHGSGKTTLSKANEVKSRFDLRVVSVVGKHGSGKTTLAKAIYNSPEVKSHFDCCAWVLASGNLTDVLLSTLEQIVSSIVDKKSTKEELTQKIHMILKEKRYLVVLDDLQTPDVWKKLLDAFPDTKNGSRVMLTTSNYRVALRADTRGEPHQLNPLNDVDTWELFLKKVRLPDNFQFSESDMFKLKRKIKRRCKGLPLAITVLGGLLSTKEVSYEVWLKVIEHPSWQLDSKQVQFSNVLALSYNDLPFHLRPCFLYLRLFPKDYDIPVRRLLRLWLAEGFVKQTSGMTPEDTVEIYLEELVKRSMIQISKRRKDGSPKTCRMLGVLHNDSNFLSKAQEIGLFHIYQLPEMGTPKHRVRRFADYVDTKEYPLRIQHLRSYLSFYIQKNDMPATEIDSFLSQVIGQGFGLLRVLDLERVYKPKLPNNMGKLFLLLSSLTHLQTLWGLFVDNKTPVKDGLYRLINLRKLGLTCHLDAFQELDEWIARLASLQSLKIRSKNQNGQPWKLNLKPLSSLENLTHLYLLGSLPELHDRYEFPPKLTVLTLSVSKLEKDPMPILAQLPSLSVLRLLADSYTGKEMECPPGGFSMLRILKLWMLKDLEIWKVGEEALPILRELEIRCCDKLQELPDKLLSLRNIKEIVLTNMPQNSDLSGILLSGQFEAGDELPRNLL